MPPAAPPTLTCSTSWAAGPAELCPDRTLPHSLAEGSTPGTPQLREMELLQCRNCFQGVLEGQRGEGCLCQAALGMLQG